MTGRVVRRRATTTAGVLANRGKQQANFETSSLQDTPNYDYQKMEITEENYEAHSMDYEAHSMDYEAHSMDYEPFGESKNESDPNETEVNYHLNQIDAHDQLRCPTKNVWNLNDVPEQSEEFPHPENRDELSNMLQREDGIEKPSNVLFTQDFQIEVGSPAATALKNIQSCKTSKLDSAKYIIQKSVQKFRGPTKRFKTIQQQNHPNPRNRISLTDKDGQEVGIDFLNVSDHVVDLESAKLNRRKKRNKNVKGNVIEREHKLYTLSIAMMLGLRFSIYNTHVLMKKFKEEDKAWLRGEEFMHNEEYSFYPDGREGTPPHNLGHLFKFKEYAPVAFAYIRRMFGFNEFEFIDSICSNNSFIEFISNSKSGQFFFYSSDGKCMVKTMTNTESKFLRRILPHYFRHCALNPNTLITKFLGMYRVKLTRLHRDVKFIIMNSVFATDQIISSIYDLKGSSVGRNAKRGESVKKDNDVREMIANDPKTAFILSPSTRIAMRKQLIKDCNFLQEMKIFDYSMLIGVHHNPTSDLKSASSDASSRREVLEGKHRTNSSSNLSESMSKNDNKRGKMMRRKSIVEESTRNLHEVQTTRSEDKLKLKDFDIEFHGNQINLVQNPYQFYSLSSTSLKNDGDPHENDIHIEEKKLQKELIIEKSYWPFHRFYEINGKFRKTPMDNIFRKSDKEMEDEEETNSKDGSNSKRTSCLFDFPEEMNVFNTEEKYPLKEYVQPFSSRDDGGLSMDTTNFDLPIEMKSARGGVQTCDGGIFYVGIIDILQQFNDRKRMEAGYKNLNGQKGASCIDPYSYADRFVRFFDEYTAVPSSTTSDE